MDIQVLSHILVYDNEHVYDYRVRKGPAKEIESIAVGLGHVPDFLEGKLVRPSATIFAKYILKVCWNESAQK